MDERPTPPKFEPPRPDKWDKAYTIGRAALSSVPYVGGAAAELLQLVFVPPLEQRRARWAEEVAQALRDLENRGVNLEELQSKDAFIDTVMYASQIALRNSQEEKREALRNAILSAGLPSPPEEALQQVFLNHVDTLTVWHLRILKFVQNIGRWAQESGYFFGKKAGCLSDVLENAYPELRGRRTFYVQVWNDLFQRGLVKQEEDVDATEPKHELEGKKTSELGDQFLRFIGEPE